MAKHSENVPVKRGGARHEHTTLAPWQAMSGLRDEIDSLFEELVAASPFDRMRRRRRSGDRPWQDLPVGAHLPALDVIDKDKEIRVCAELPGMDRDEIEVRVTDNSLTIRGEKREEMEEGDEQGRHYLAERRFGAFQRSVDLPDGIDSDKIEAEFRNGVLTIHLPKTPAAQKKSRKVEVKSK